MNTITISGLLGTDPNICKSKKGPITYFTLYHKHRENTSKLNIIACEARGENMAKTLHKGDRVIISGRLQIRDKIKPDKTIQNITDIIVSTYERVIKL